MFRPVEALHPRINCMTYYFCGLSFKMISLKRKSNEVYLFNVRMVDSLFITALRRIPFIRTKVNSLILEPNTRIGDYKGLFYRINEEALECTEFVYDRLELEDCQFIKVYNQKFKTNKFKPFVLKWVSSYVFDLIKCLYRVHLDKPSQKILYLHNNLLNQYIYEWWSEKTGNKMEINWLRKSEVGAGLEAMVSIWAFFIYKLLSRGLCLIVKPKRFKIIEEAVHGLRTRLFRDDFFIDNKRLLKRDLLLYTYGTSHELRMLSYKDAQNSEYECMNINKLKVPVSLLFQRLLKYHFLLPLVLIFKNFNSKQNYLLRKWLPEFHQVAIGYETLLSHYQIGLELVLNGTGLVHTTKTIILNNYGAKNVVYQLSDMTVYDSVSQKFKSHNIYLVWGKIHYDFQEKQYCYINEVIETGCWLRPNFDNLVENKRDIYKKLKLPIDAHKMLVFYDESFDPDAHFTEETLLDFWQMMFELIDGRKDVIAILKSKGGTKDYSTISDKGKEIFNNIKERCLESGRFYLIDNPREVDVTEVMGISDINITMGMASPSTIALLCGKIGLYYDTTGNDQHPFTKKYRNKVVFDSKGELFSTVNRIIDDGYSPLNEIEEELLRDYDHFRDDMGMERFREALLKSV